jgi:hypothetical protein
MNQQLQLGRYEFYPYTDERKHDGETEMTTEEMLEFLKSKLEEPAKKRATKVRSNVRSRVGTTPKR